VPVDAHWSTELSIPHEATSPENDTLEAAILPPQKCVETVKCIPERRISSENDMDKNFFIQSY